MTFIVNTGADVFLACLRVVLEQLPWAAGVAIVGAGVLVWRGHRARA